MHECLGVQPHCGAPRFSGLCGCLHERPLHLFLFEFSVESLFARPSVSSICIRTMFMWLLRIIRLMIRVAAFLNCIDEPVWLWEAKAGRFGPLDAYGLEPGQLAGLPELKGVLEGPERLPAPLLRKRRCLPAAPLCRTLPLPSWGVLCLLPPCAKEERASVPKKFIGLPVPVVSRCGRPPATAAPSPGSCACTVVKEG